MKILLATDGSEYSEGAARFLTHLNLTQDDEIDILHAISWAPIMHEWESLYSDFREIRKDVAPKILDSAANILKATGAKIKTSCVDEYPDKAIIDAAVNSKADMIVMGARGIRGIASHIIGSITRTVTIKSPVPVLAIMPPQQKISGSMKILFATDGSAQSSAAGRFLASIPFPENTELTVLNVLPTEFEDIPERFALEINERMKNIMAATREKELKGSTEIIKKALEDLGGKFKKIEKISKCGDPSLEILRTAEAAGADIIAVGTSGMRGIKGMLGSVSRYILNHSGCSVLIGKA